MIFAQEECTVARLAINLKHGIRSNKLYKTKELNQNIKTFFRKLKRIKFERWRGELNLSWSITSSISYHWVTDTLKFLKVARFLVFVCNILVTISEARFCLKSNFHSWNHLEPAIEPSVFNYPYKSKCGKAWS